MVVQVIVESERMNQYRRRRLLVAMGAMLAAPATVLAQRPPERVVRIGFLGMPAAAGWARMVAAFREGLRDLGYVEGKNLVIEFRWAEGQYDRLPGLAKELVGLDVDVIVTHATSGVLAAKGATATIPIVIAASGDAVATGLVSSLSRPGGNVTGSSFLGPAIAAKRLDLVKEAMPRARRVGLLYNERSAYDSRTGALLSVQAVERAARERGLELLKSGVRRRRDLETAVAKLADAGGVDVMLINEDPMLVANARAIVAAALKHRYPTVGFAQIAEAGGLMAYGAGIAEMHRRAAYFVDKIVKGAKPADLPVEQPTRFELIVNLGTARALGVAVPLSILVRAARVIE